LLRELSLHILDIAENSIQAKAKKIEVSVFEDSAFDRLRITIKDDGHGMSIEKLNRISDPFVTSRTTRKVGLGIPFLKEAAEACNGFLRVNSIEGEGTTLEVEFQRSHIDRMPLGDLSGTFLTLLVGYPQIHWAFRYQNDHKEFLLDDQDLKKELSGIPLSDATVLAYLKKTLDEGIGAASLN
jgi:hypothetical protein